MPEDMLNALIRSAASRISASDAMLYLTGVDLVLWPITFHHDVSAMPRRVRLRAADRRKS